MANLQTSLAESKYAEAWSQFLSMVKRNPTLKAAEFYDSVSINVPGYKMWLSDHGYGQGFRENRNYARKLLREELQNDDEDQETDSMETNIDADAMVVDEYKESNADDKQYWWLNVPPETWDIESAGTSDKKTISFFVDKKVGKDEFEGSFIKWLYCYFIDREDNPHFSLPINIWEPSISYLDFTGRRGIFPWIATGSPHYHAA